MQNFLISSLTTWFFLLTSSLFAHNAKIEYLTPPILSSKTLSERIVCTRPMRDRCFNISIGTCGSKKLIHCYGQGGSGCTTLFGSVYKAIELFEHDDSSKYQPIRVIGSGCIGLTSAIELTRRGYRVVGITTEEPYDIASWKAAGYFALVSVQTSPEEQDSLNEIGMKTFLAYREIEQGRHPYISKDAVRFMPVYCSEDTDAGVEDLEARGLIPKKEYVTLDFGNGVRHEGFVKYLTYFMNTSTIMRQLIQEVKRLGIPIEVKKIHSFDDIQEPVIFNCTGMGGRDLNHDDSLIPVRGHLITLTPDSGNCHMDYMIYTKVKQDDTYEYIYLFPKNSSVTSNNIEGTPCAGVLGGTFIPHVDKLSAEEQEALDRREFKRLLDRNALFFTGHPFE